MLAFTVVSIAVPKYSHRATSLIVFLSKLYGKVQTSHKTILGAFYYIVQLKNQKKFIV